MDIQDKAASYKGLHKLDESPVKHRIWVASYIIVGLSALTVYLLLKLHVFHVSAITA